MGSSTNTNNIPSEYIQQCTTNFQTLLHRSSSLLHGIDHASSSAWTKTKDGLDDDAGDDTMEVDAMEDSTVEEEEEDSEDDASLLKRASSVHAALFLSLPSSKSSSNADVTIATAIGMELVQELVQSILENSTDERDGNRAWKELITSLSFALAPTNNNNNNNNTNNNRNGIGKEQWRKICLTNALLAIQYLLHLMPNGGDGSSAHCMADTLNGWNTVILPMLFGTPPSSSSLSLLLSTKKEQRSASLLIKNDALRNALLNLRPSASSSTVPSSNNHSTTTTTTSDTTAANLVIEQCKHTCTLCLNALRQITSSSSPNKQPVVLVVLMKRQKTIIVICQVLLRLLEDIAKLSKKKIITQSMAVGGLEEVVDKCMDIGKDAVHRAVLMVLRGVCYDSVVVGNDHGITTSGEIATTTAEMVIQPPLLSLEALRPITGMLLPQLYPPSAPSSSTSSSSKNVKGAGEESPIVDRRVLEIWNEILLLLAPYSTSLIGGDEEMEIGGRKLRCCQNWNNVAPMAATSILCILLPTFRSMELPTNFNSDKTSTEQEVVARSRPAYQSSVWMMIRNCLGRCGESDNFGGSARGGGDGNGDDGSGAKGRGVSHIVVSSYQDGQDGSSMDDSEGYDRAAMDQLLRRRSAHVLRIMIEYERELLLKSAPPKRRKVVNSSSNDNSSDSATQLADLWTKYVLCFEMLEMEIELHLVDQVWPTMLDLCAACGDGATTNGNGHRSDTLNRLPHLKWGDIMSLLNLVLLSDAPTLRKLGLFRFLSGHAGVANTVPQSKSLEEETKNEDKGKDSVFMKNPKSKYKIKKNSGAKGLVEPAPLSIVSVSFVIDVVIRSYDSIIGTKVGTNMQVDEKGKLISEDVTCLLRTFISNYVTTLATIDEGNARLSAFVSGVFGPRLIQNHKTRTLAILYSSVAAGLDADRNVSSTLVLEPETIRSSIRSIQATFASGGAPKSTQDGLMQDLALALKHTMPWQKPDVSLILQVLALFPPEEASADATDSIFANSAETESSRSLARKALGSWISKIGDGKWSVNAAPACASAFVSGQLMPFVEMEVSSGVDKSERETGMSICILCSMSGNASAMLWPAVFKGLQSIPPITATKTPAFYKATRSIILLEFGCREGVLSGMGNGEIVLDENSKCMMPPPPNIESLLNNAVQFLLAQVMSMSTILGGDDSGDNKASGGGGASRSTASSSVSSYIAMLVGQIKILHESFPSSNALSLAVDSMLQKSIDTLATIVESQASNATNVDPVDVVKFLTLSYAALSCGALLTDSSKESGNEKLKKLLSTIQIVLNAKFSMPSGVKVKREVVQACRSVFQYAKWGTLSLLVPMMDTCDGVDLDHTLIFGKVKEDNNIKALDSHPSAAAVAKVAQSSAAHKTSRRTKDNLLASGPQTRANIPSNDDSDEEDGMGLGTLFGQDDDGDDDSDGDGMGLGNLFDEDDDSSSEDGMGLGNLFGQEEDDDDDDDDDDEDMGLDTLFAQGQGDDYNGGSKKSNSAPGNADMERHNQIDEATSGSGILSVQELYQAIFELARDSVQATPVIALSPLFETAVSAGKHIVKLSASSDQREKSSLLGSLNMIIEILFSVLEDVSNSTTWMYMLNEMCKLIFNQKLLLEEYNFSFANDNNDNMPILSAFERMMSLGGTTKPHINATAVSRISAAWMCHDGFEADMGVCAIPYRTHIANLLFYKECKLDESTANQALSKDQWSGALPEATDDLSITRGFVLLFLSKLPSPEVMSNIVLKELIHFIIMFLLDNVCCAKVQPGDIFISGSVEYGRRSRAWQALCLLSRFVTDDIAEDVATRAYHAMSMNSHGQIRYFMEVFTIQSTRKHPLVFGHRFIKEIRRTDPSLQYVSSLMIIGGNLIVGRYSTEFFNASSKQRIKDVLCGAIPWLSSTQGFSRAIAQLLVHALIPLVVDITSHGPVVNDDASEKDEAVLRNMYSFLEGNSDMSRLRSKQQRFFDSYDVDSACLLEGLLSIPVDEGDEACPVHMVDAIKNCLADVYKEAHDGDAPAWKQMEDLLIDAERANVCAPSSNSEDKVHSETELVNFQRKILPIDALDLSIKSVREQKMLNAAGKKKQQLIVCATLVDKVPNLAGLARTAEIFAAQKLVVPDLFVKRLDNFKSISASANDWIDMEECKEEDLLNWLYKKKKQGYAIVGLEQTSSSKCLTKIEFPERTVLLLGKEKEGIPVEFLSAVDQCIEIPQLGIIRSLNVHVTGAIAIWKYTEQMLQKSRN